VIREKVARQQPDDLAPLADRDLGIEGEPPCEFSAQSRAADWPPNHKSTRRANVDCVEMLELFGQRRRSEGSVTADVDAPQKNHECHAFASDVERGMPDRDGLAAKDNAVAI
jgi:hypothetical protein